MDWYDLSLEWRYFGDESVDIRRTQQVQHDEVVDNSEIDSRV